MKTEVRISSSVWSGDIHLWCATGEDLVLMEKGWSYKYVHKMYVA